MAHLNQHHIRNSQPNINSFFLPSSTLQSRRTKSSKFFLFDRLPPEIRHEIWYFAALLAAPRNVEICLYPKNTRKRFFSKTPAPPLVRVCRDSRQASLRIYKPLILNGFNINALVMWEHDRVYMTSTECITELLKLVDVASDIFGLFQNVRHLAIPRNAFKNGLFYKMYIPNRQLTELRELFVVTETLSRSHKILEGLDDQLDTTTNVHMQLPVQHPNFQKACLQIAKRKPRPYMTKRSIKYREAVEWRMLVCEAALREAARLELMLERGMYQRRW